ncbi:methionine gamma-lyase [Paenibacillus sp. PK3_47]|uniref:trans-sulfuration enzyme family protein n=1 Tax=Paenibacillus sp. PK3_47 TaxID=2072642 RepID=UPI00201DB875|nr:aminotransferase class I/II-fold pyridoxal phosphate-dependent enzyme [Paenibacillus sp. PK3_47]UQZ36728.1 methionine gamma-lyase [Paenibacillus sp. PK3_47]
MSTPEDLLTCIRFEDEAGNFMKAAAPPIYETAPFLFNTYEEYAEAANNEQNHYVYTRGTNPTVEIAEKMIAALEGGASCKCFASGMAAVSAALMCSLSAGDHLILVGHVYKTSVKLVKYLAKKFNIDYTIVHSTSLDDVAAAVKPQTRVMLMESPTSYTFDIADISELAAFSKTKGIRTIIDNSWATPLFQKPLELGVDIVVHSASKYLGGHSDLVAGAVISSKNIMDQMYAEEFDLMGGCLAPFEAWLLVRGLRTLPLRMQAHQNNGLHLARFLAEHPAVAKVNHPGLPAHPGHRTASRQLKGYSGLFSFELKDGGFEDIRRMLNRLCLIRIGESWGGMESQIISPNYGYNEQELTQEHMPQSLIRLAAGHEPSELLIQDLHDALS